MMATAEHPREGVMDALAVLMCLERGDVESADLMVATYTDEPQTLLSAITAITLCAVRYGAIASGQTPERLLAGIAQEVRDHAK